MKKGYLIISIIQLTGYSSYTQNLVQNSSFEEYRSTKYWFSSDRYCGFPFGMNFFGVRTMPREDFFDFEYIDFKPQAGNFCFGMQLYVPETSTSDYLVTTISGLSSNKKYALSFYITPNDSCGYAVNNIDVLICDSNYLIKNISCLSPQKIFIKPTVSFDISNLSTGNQQGKWIKLETSFTAAGDENIMVIGNFSNPDVSKYFFRRKYLKKKKETYENSAFYFLDDFMIKEIK